MVKPEIVELVAKRIWQIGAADQMITSEESSRSWELHKEQKSQKYLCGTYEALTALIVMEELGYLPKECLR